MRNGQAIAMAVLLATTLSVPSGAQAQSRSVATRVEVLEDAVSTLQAQGSALLTQIVAANSTISSLQSQLATANDAISALQTQLATANSTISALQTDVATVQSNNVLALGPYVNVVTNEMNRMVGPHVVFSGVNVHIRSGSGWTGDRLVPGGMLTGLGNLVVGYNEVPIDAPVPNPFCPTCPPPRHRDGSHNIILGTENNFLDAGGFVAGVHNTISGKYATVSGGFGNEASGHQSVVSGGYENRATEVHSGVSGGLRNEASGPTSIVSGGANRTAPGDNDWVAGGLFQDN